VKALFATAVTLAIPSAAAAEPIDLVCHGVARTVEAQQSFGSAYGSSGNSASGSATTYRTAKSDEMLRIRIDDGGATGKVKLPRALIPAISKGKEGWWDFVQLAVGDDAIRGQISLNVLNHPKIVIDRRTGDVDLKGLGETFGGSCEKAPETPNERKF
jgi:hypothetical protein